MSIAALHCMAERVQRTQHVTPVHPEIEREVVPRAGRDTDEGKAVSSGGRGHDRERAVPTRHAERVCAPVHDRLDPAHVAVAGGEEDDLDPQFARPRGEGDAGRTCRPPPVG